MGLGTSNIWSSNWLVAAIYCVFFTLLAAFPLRNSLHSAESALLTQAMSWTNKTPSNDLAIISIDQKSLDNVGPWPWQRSVLAQVIELLADNGARAIATTVRLDTPKTNSGDTTWSKSGIVCNPAMATNTACDSPRITWTRRWPS